jgi:Rad3-related DNA helicase
MLESPTKSGKRLALLSSVLHFQENSDEHPKIFYSSRTYSQFKQVISELKKLNYQPLLGILASKYHLCLNEKNLKLSDIEESCTTLSCITKECPSVSSTQIPEDFFHLVYDLEDLIEYGKSN